MKSVILQAATNTATTSNEKKETDEIDARYQILSKRIWDGVSLLVVEKEGGIKHEQ